MKQKLQSIKFKILLAALVGIIGFAVYLSYALSVARANSVLLQEIRDRDYPVLSRSSSSQVGLDRIIETLNNAASSGDEELVGEADVMASELRALLDEIAGIDGAQTVRVSDIKSIFSTYYTLASELARGLIQGSLESETLNSKAEAMQGSLDTVRDKMGELTEMSRQQFYSAIDDANSSAHEAVYWGAGFGLIISLVIAFVSNYFSSSIARNIINITAALQELAKGKGDLTVRLQSGSKDELNELVDGFNRFMDKMQDLVGKVKGSSNQLIRSGEELSAISESSREGMLQQRQETAQVATATTQMAATALQIAQNAAQAALASQDATMAVSKGKEVVGESVNAFMVLASAVEETSIVVSSLADESLQIGGVIDVIKKISDQTNLLALNAAIEAARAGEHGRGFAVVSDEVRTLAMQTRQATEQISELIVRLQDGSRSAVQAMNQSREVAKTGVDRAGKVHASLEEITASVINISDTNTQIATAAEQQSAVVEEINRNTVRITDIADKTSEDADLNSGASAKMLNLSAELDGLVSQFILCK